MPTSPLNVQPSQAFMDRAVPIVQQWEQGGLPADAALEQLSALVQESAQFGMSADQAQGEIMIGFVYSYLGKSEVAIQRFRTARALFEKAGSAERVLLCDTNIAETYWAKGDLPRARQMYNSAYLAAKAINSLRIQATCIAQVGRVLLEQGFVGRARPALEEGERLALQAPERGRILGNLCEIYRDLMIVYAKSDEPVLAWESAKKALSTAVESKSRLPLGTANRAIGELLTALASPPENAGEFSTDPDFYFRAAMSYFADLKAEVEIARTLVVHGESLALRGHRMTGARKLQQAARIFANLDMLGEAAKADQVQARILTDLQSG